MIPLLFFRQRFYQQLITFFFVFIFSFVSLSSQTIIKEKVIINPKANSSQLQKSATTYNPILFGFGGMRPFMFSITGPAGSGGGSNGGYGAPASEVYVPAAYGEYHVVVTTNFLDSYSNVGYYAVWLDPSGTTQWVAGYDMWFYPDRWITVKEDRFIFNRVPPLPPPPPPPPPPPVQDNIKISMTGEKSIWPELPAGQSHIAGYNPRTNIQVKATNGNQSLANQKVKISITRIEGTGGHDHPNSSVQTLWGRISVNGVNGNPVTAFTNQNGEITTEEILASEFGGEYIIEAALESKPTIRDTVHFIVRVPNLFPLAPSKYYELTGSPDNYHCQPKPTSQHNSNHYGSLQLITAIQNIAIRYYFYSNGIRALINDMSIVNGGKFDINNKWTGDHSEHKVGKNADISFKGIDSNNKCIPMSQIYLETLFKDFANDKLLKHLGNKPGEQPHYHMRIK